MDDGVGCPASWDPNIECISPDLDAATGWFARPRFADEVDRAVRLGDGVVLVLRIEPTTGAEGNRGNARGLELLQASAQLIEKLAETDTLLGRVGQSELGILLSGQVLESAGRLAQCLVKAVRAQDFVLGQGRTRAKAWGGLVRYTRDVQASSRDLLIDAEEAWRRARELDRLSVWLPNPVRETDRKRICRDRLASGMRAGAFTLYAQPILELATNRITRHEILLRVVDAAAGPSSPGTVLETAERLDAIFELDLWVLERTMQLLSKSPKNLHLQVNLSGRSLGDARLLGAVEELITRYQVNPAQLTFEMTETAVISNVTEAKRFAHWVRQIGCQLALDDFGAGYGSFRSLKAFPIDLVKIDGEFIENLADSHEDQVLVGSLVKICQAYGIRTVAEFVQDPKTLELLRDMGVDLVQGYLIGRPQPIELGWEPCSDLD
jgi:EAL domain-containing protein (putative c-di-GMP-specific phosphodiesterase class I)/GGDEF domain-containing protein